MFAFCTHAADSQKQKQTRGGEEAQDMAAQLEPVVKLQVQARLLLQLKAVHAGKAMDVGDTMLAVMHRQEQSCSKISKIKPLGGWLAA